MINMKEITSYMSHIEEHPRSDRKNLVPIVVNVDSTYFDIQGPKDVELLKLMYYFKITLTGSM